MDNNIDAATSTLPAALNQNIELRILTAFNAHYQKAVEYAAANGIKKPNKGVFCNYVVRMGLQNSPIDYFFNQF